MGIGSEHGMGVESGNVVCGIELAVVDDGMRGGEKN